MSHQITYRIEHRYQSLKGGISIPTILTVGSRSADCIAKVDTGAEYCLFQRGLAERLGLKLEDGHRTTLESLTGVFTAYGHEVTLQTLDIAFDVTVYFAADYEVPRNLLGRHGWLQQVRLGLNDYDEILYLSACDDLP